MYRLAGSKVSDGMEALHKLIRRTNPIEGFFTHPCHDAHADDNVDGIGDLNTGFRVGRIGMSHHVRDHVKCPTFHAAVKEFGNHSFGFGRFHPVVVRSLRLLS